MSKGMRSFRARMILLLGLSMLFSGIVTYALYKALQFYYLSDVRYEDDTLANLRHFIRSIGDLNFFLIIYVPLTIAFFYLLMAPYVSYFKKISASIRRLAEGDFTSRIEIRSRDEFQSIAEDINLTSEKLKQAVERGDFAESSKDQLVLNLAHDLRTPLTSVIGYLDYVLNDKDLSPEKSRHYTTIAYAKAHRLETLINELFEVTQLNYGLLPIEAEELDLAELLAQLSEEMYPVFDKNGLTARLDLFQPLRVQGNGELLARVFENLAMNAARYGRDGRYVEIRCLLEGEEAVVQFINYGSSISPEDQPHLFEMFYTGDKARQSDSGGTGIGLFIAKNIVERHQGTISAYSDVIRTCFEVRLPLRMRLKEDGSGAASAAKL
ncbi:sensor histidine kinase [Paenibacillus herberti]|uniref:histidine kinase n=1 Tax=Paenibacillus herberti TaxID=1619309 RepID=A0A229P0Y8_9BACL|nr:HAMP domain-containing sensor histidine kinase [Paenibacillus herberti]OXM15559.1 vancomycin resistance histidine kinase VanS [Paenibacillus herberti]